MTTAVDAATKAREILESASEVVASGPAATLARVLEVEQTHGIRLPPSYTWFATNVGAIYIEGGTPTYPSGTGTPTYPGGTLILGLPPSGGGIGLPDAEWLYGIGLRVSGEARYFEVASDVQLDLDRRDDDGECMVVAGSWRFGRSDLCRSFGQWLLEVVQTSIPIALDARSTRLGVTSHTYQTDCYDEPGHVHHVARCSCGWSGPVRPDERAADLDGRQHCSAPALSRPHRWWAR